MESILVLTHTEESGSALTQVSMEAVSAGLELSKQLGAPLTVGIITGSSNVPMTGLPACRVLLAANEAFLHPRYASDAAACEAICRAAKATIILAQAGSRFARVIAGVAYRLGGVVDTHITALDAADGLTATRWFYRQRIEGSLKRETRPWILLMESGAYPPFAGGGGDFSTEAVAVNLPGLRTAGAGFREATQGEQTIRPDAKLLFVAGAGWTKKQPDGQVHAGEAGELILRFLHETGASLGSSKSLVDQGNDGTPVLPFLTHMNQVGQTGSTPRHAKGLSTCCHGEEPHVVGWRFIHERRAISLDPNCGWARGKADVVYVADAFQVVAKLNELLAKHQAGPCVGDRAEWSEKARAARSN